MFIIFSAHGQGSAPDGEVPPNDQTTVDASETVVPEQPEPEPSTKPRPKTETAETFVPTEDISEDRSVSFPVDI